MCETEGREGSEFLRKLRRYGRRQNLAVRFDPALGKGSHGRVWLGEAYTTLKDRKKDLGPGLLKAMCHDLGLEADDL